MDAAATAPIELIATESSSTSHDNSGKEGEHPEYAAIRSRPTHRDDAYREEELQTTISRMYGGVDEEQRETLRQIASLRRSKTAISDRPELERWGTLAGVSDNDPRLNPENPEFDVYMWSRALMRAKDEDQIRVARAGFTFKDPNVSGSGAALSLHQDVSSALIAPFRLGEYFTTGKKLHKRILRDFDGIVKNGEMLVVLGRPGWMEWISYINPIQYAFEAVLVKEVHGRRFPCGSAIPPSPFQSGSSFTCAISEAVAGENDVSGDVWVQASYGYSYSHIWRNLGIIFAFQIFFLVVYLVATEINSSTSSSAEVLVFRRGHIPKYISDNVNKQDGELGTEAGFSSVKPGRKGS